MQEVHQRIAQAQEKLQELRNRKQKFQNKLAKYKDLASIRAEQNLFSELFLCFFDSASFRGSMLIFLHYILEKQIDIRKMELADVKSKVDSQVITKEEFNEKNAELTNIKNQRKALSGICKELEAELEPKLAAVQNAHTKVCLTLTHIFELTK